MEYSRAFRVFATSNRRSCAGIRSAVADVLNHHLNLSRTTLTAITAAVDRFDRSVRYNFRFFLETSGSLRSAWCQSFSSVRRFEAEKTPKNQNDFFWTFCQVPFGRFDNPFGSIVMRLHAMVDRPGGVGQVQFLCPLCCGAGE